MAATSPFCPLCGAPTPGGVCSVHGVADMSHAATDPRQVFVPGAVLGGRYRIDAMLSLYGAQASLLATRSDGVPVVIETLGVERLARRARLLDQLFREAGIPRLFHRPDLVEILDYGVEPRTQNPFLVLAYTPGRAPQQIAAPDAAEKRTALAFVEVCHSLLDTHDGEILQPANAMPTAVPGAMPTLVPGAPPAPPLTAPASPQPPAPAPAKSASEIPETPDVGTWGRNVIVGTIVLGLIIYWVIPDPALTARFYNPNITQPVTLYQHPGAGEDPRRYQTGEVLGEQLQIDSDPSEAEVWSDGSLLGETPLTVPKPRGAQRLRLVIKKEGYLDKALNLNFDSRDTTVKLLGGEEDPADRDRLMGTREAPKGLLDQDPFDPEAKDRFGKDPMRNTPFTNPFGEPGTAPAMPGIDDNPYDDDDSE